MEIVEYLMLSNGDPVSGATQFLVLFTVFINAVAIVMFESSIFDDDKFIELPWLTNRFFALC